MLTALVVVFGIALPALILGSVIVLITVHDLSHWLHSRKEDS
jgi:hypothetical protein